MMHGPPDFTFEDDDHVLTVEVHEYTVSFYKTPDMSPTAAPEGFAASMPVRVYQVEADDPYDTDLLALLPKDTIEMLELVEEFNLIEELARMAHTFVHAHKIVNNCDP